MRQSRSDIKRIIDAATKDGTLGELFYYIVIDAGYNKQIPAAVNDFVPVVRVAPDPAISEHDAHLMLEIIRHYSPGMIMRLELTAIDILEDCGVQWFEFGAIDLVCESCGAVGWDSCCCRPNIWRVDNAPVYA